MIRGTCGGAGLAEAGSRAPEPGPGRRERAGTGTDPRAATRRGPARVPAPGLRGARRGRRGRGCCGMPGALCSQGACQGRAEPRGSLLGLKLRTRGTPEALHHLREGQRPWRWPFWVPRGGGGQLAAGGGKARGELGGLGALPLGRTDLHKAGGAGEQVWKGCIKQLPDLDVPTKEVLPWKYPTWGIFNG